MAEYVTIKTARYWSPSLPELDPEMEAKVRAVFAARMGAIMDQVLEDAMDGVIAAKYRVLPDLALPAPEERDGSV